MTSSDPQTQGEAETHGHSPAQWSPDLLLSKARTAEAVPFRPDGQSSRQEPRFHALQVRTESPPGRARDEGRPSSSKAPPGPEPRSAPDGGRAPAAEPPSADVIDPRPGPTSIKADATRPATAHAPVEPGAGRPKGTSSTAGPADAAATQALQDAAYARGLADGQARARAQDIAARQRQETLLEQLIATLEHHAAGTVDWSTPMKRLCLRLAEEIVRGELQRPRIVERLVEQGLAALGESPQRPVVRLHPDDLAVLSPLLPRFQDRCRFEAVTGMSRGSVEVAADDTLMQDLIENRLRALAEQLFQDDDASSAGAATDD